MNQPSQTFPKNAWYVACTAAELDHIDGKPFGRKICNEAMVFFRNEQGAVAALEDFCPHRGAPLSLGTVCAGKLTCGYHGLEMGCEGKTIAMPSQRVRGFPAIKVFPAVERYGFIWVWPGDAAQADTASIQHLAWFDKPAWAYGGGLYHINCDYRLMVDNLMDLTHETYVHASTIGQKEIDEVPCKTSVDGDTVITSRFMSGIMAPPFWKMALRGNKLADDVPVDRWQVCRFTPPSNVHIEVGVAHAGYGGIDAPDDKKVYAIVTDFITPESDTSIWYFWGMARKFQPADAALTDSVREGQGKIFSEDREMLERQQKNILAYPERKLLMLNIDEGGQKSRKVIARLIQAEIAAENAVLV